MMSDSTPICRCRVLYLGSSVPQQTKDGLQGIQEPLQVLYPEEGAVGAKGIDSWLSVWSNGILLENVDENHKKITRFFPIESLHYCAAIRYVLVPEKNTLHNPSPRFLPLDSPFARAPNPTHPPLFAAILRRTTGIKVLECHAFICKREVAANALVRCCFHAYADSSYAKQVDTAGSLYGTLASQKTSSKAPTMIDGKLEDWKMNRSISGSTMSINTITPNGKEDAVSIYNGDENHKVWAGSQDHLDGGGGGGGIYDLYSTSTISRTPRPRQIAAPVPVPPPPAKDKGSAKKQKKQQHHQQRNGSISASREDLYHPLMMNGKANSVSGTLLKSKIPPNMMHPHHHQQPIYVMAHPAPGVPPPHQTLPNPKFAKHYGNTFSHRPRGRVLVPARPIPPPLVPMPANIVIPHTSTLTKKSKKASKMHHQQHLHDEPIYLPSRALSPPSYQPVMGLAPHEAAYMMHHAPHPHHNQYATMEMPPGRMTAKKNGAKASKMSKKLAQSMNGLDDPALIVGPVPTSNGVVNGGGDESPYSTGIYKKKGHLNERAFSYSIRQEHRSRSYGSLANLKFATPIPNGHHDVEDRVEDFKKEREIMQMVHDLDLSGDEIERSEVPRGIYESRLNSSPLVITSAQINGRPQHAKK